MTNESQKLSSEIRQKAENNAIDGQGLKVLTEAALTWLKTNQQMVNTLNVFPVPDGDTGTNMVLTMQAAYNEISNSSEPNIGIITQAIAKGALMGARGNSGVILSQIWRGFARTLDNKENMATEDFVRALVEARDTAYKGVVRPVEGTILTVATAIAFEAQAALEDSADFLSLFSRVVEAADISVKHTPELLPILKQAGVVDAGGKGLFFIFEGMLRYLNDEPLGTPLTNVQPLSLLHLDDAMNTIEPGQDYEVVIDFAPDEPFNVEKYYDSLSDMGTSIQMGEGEGIYRMHIHVPTDKRYSPIDYTMQIGTISKVYIENLIAEMESLKEKSGSTEIELLPVQPGQIAVVVISPGLGLSRVFASLGVAAIVTGGQTMNPSTEEILASFEDLDTDKVIILPNNKNIILAAQAAAEMSKKQATVIPSTSIPQGLNAALCLIPNDDYEGAVKTMTKAITEVETGEITTATRSVEINGVKVKKGEVIALHNGKLIESTNSLTTACLSLLISADAKELERITLFYGCDITIDEVNSVVGDIGEEYPDHEIEIHEGGQQYYQFIISIE